MAELRYPAEEQESSFSSVAAYSHAVALTPLRLARRCGAVGTADAELTEMKARSGGEMQRQLRWYDVMALGIGGMMGAGVFVATGRAANEAAGPAIVVSFAISGLAALLSSLCYTDFAVQVPAAGGAFSYTRITLGELAAYLTGANLVLEYVISNAVVARSFTSYFAAVFGVNNPDTWRVSVNSLPPDYNKLDFLALAVVIVMTIGLCRSTKNSSTFNVLITILHLLLMVFIIVAGFSKGTSMNLVKPSTSDKPAGFAPFGVKGIFEGAAIVFYSYVGYDSVSTLAEETHKPAKTMPVAISGSVLVVSLIYCLLAASLVFLVPYDQIDVQTPFPVAFGELAGWKWASSVVALCACIGIVSSLMVAMLGQARYVCVIGRANLIPAWFANVNGSTGTPVNAAVTLGGCTAMVALFTDLVVLGDMLNVGILFVFYMVSNALIVRRHVSREGKGMLPTSIFLVACTALSVTFATIVWAEVERKRMGVELVLCGGALLFCTLAFNVLMPAAEEAAGQAEAAWRAPVMLLVAVASIFLNVFLVASLKAPAFKRFGLWTAGTLLFYVLYSVHAAHDAEKQEALKSSAAYKGYVEPPGRSEKEKGREDDRSVPFIVAVR